MSEIKLLPCPFCGGEAECYTVQTMQLETGFVVKCKNLDCVMCSGGTLRQTPEEAIKAWNTRKPMQEIVSKLDELEVKVIYDPFSEEYRYKGIDVKDVIEIVKEEGGFCD